MSTVERGTVKWFNDAKGFGFINHHSGKDIFVHFSVIEGEGFKTLKDGELVEYEATEGPKGLNASRVIRISQNEGAPASAPANGLAQEIEVIRTEEPSTSHTSGAHTSDPTTEGGSREETRFTEFSQDLEERELDPSKEQQIVSPVRDENGESLKTSTTLS